MLMGITLIYGATGQFNLNGTSIAPSTGLLMPSFIEVAGIILLFVSMCFKVSAAPFHFWTPDVYDGAPSFFTAFMSTVVKTAGFAALYKLLHASFTDVYNLWWMTIAASSLLTLFIGNLTATSQTSFKRMMAYSGISHAGYLLIAIAAFNEQTVQALIFYTLAYSVATVSAFAVLIQVADSRGSNEYSAFYGLHKTNPFLAFALTVSMMSLAGIPLTAGFFGKFFIFLSAVEANLIWLVVGAVLMSAVGIYYYFRVVIAMYMREGKSQAIEVSSALYFVLAVTTLVTILLGVAPGWLANAISI
jgi:NADH-quinone oxidoreductase subunit N